MKKMLDYKIRKSLKYDKMLYFIGALILVLTVWGLYRHHKYLIDDEVKRTTQKLRLIESSMKNKIDEIENVANQIKINKNIDVNNIRIDPYNRKVIISELKKLQQSRKFIEDIIVYLEGETYLYTSTTTSKMERLWSNLYQYENWSEKELIDSLLYTERAFVRPSESFVGKGKLVSFIYPLTKNGITNYGTVIILVKEEELINDFWLENIQGMKSILNEDQVILVYGEEEFIDEHDVVKPYSFLRAFSTYRLLSGDYKIETTFVMNNKEINRKMRDTLVGSILLFLCLLFVTCYAINSILKSFSKVIATRETPTEIKRKYVIHELLTGGDLEQEDLKELKMTQDPVAVALIGLPKVDDQEEIIRRVALEEIGNTERLNGIFHVENTNLICILTGKELSEESIIQFLQNVKDNLKIVLDEECAISLGKVYENYLSIYKSHIEASEAMGYKLVYGNKKIIIYNNVCQRNALMSGVPSETIKNLVKYTSYKDTKGLEVAINNIKSYVETSYLPIYVIRGMCYNMVYEILREIKQKANTDIKTKLRQLLQTLEEKGLEEFLDDLRDVVMMYFDSEASTKVSQLERMLAYIDGNYLNIDFTTESMADHFNISSANLCQIFKHLTDKTISEHVVELRMDKAKELLINTEQPLKNIAIEVGYYHVSSFIRRFKKMEGITPGEFRSKNKSHR